MKIDLTFSGNEVLLNKMKKLAVELNRSLPSLAAQGGRQLAIQYGAITAPLGMQEESAAKTKFEGRVAAEIRRVFATRDNPSSVFVLIKSVNPEMADLYWAAHKNKDEKSMLRIISAVALPTGNMEWYHKRARTFKNGRVPDRYAAKSLVKKTELEAFIRRKVKLIGTAKAGWHAAAKSLGGRIRRNMTDESGNRYSQEVFPSYVTRLSRSQKAGSSDVSAFRGKAEARIFSRVRHGDEAFIENMLVVAEDAAQNDFYNAVKIALEWMMRKTVR